jgi:hypothetical protein
LPTVLADLGRIPLIGTDLASAIAPSVGEKTMNRLFGRNNTWMYRTIGSIRDEKKFQRVILRLLQAQLPRYAQIRHGPLEYGKDIVVLTEPDGRYLLQMYQAKVGNITTPVWRSASDELEEMFLVPLSELQLPNAPDELEGVLIFNGHFNQHVEPVALGWRDEQARVHGRKFIFMHIDSIIDWIVRKGLVTELRKALEEQGIDIIN